MNCQKNKKGFYIEKTKKSPSQKTSVSVGTILHLLVTAVSVLIFFGCIYLHCTYPNEKPEELLFYLTNGAGNAGYGPIVKALAFIVPVGLSVTALLFIIQYPILRYCVFFGFKSKKDGAYKAVRIFPVKHRKIFTAALCLALVISGLSVLGVFSYIKAQISSSDFFEENYVDPKSVSVTAPQNKRNILVIEMESLETTMFSREHGGINETEIMPELYDLLQLDEAVYFASDKNTRGVLDGYGTTWTTASLIANTSGIAFKVPTSAQANAYCSENFLYGAYSLGDVLKDNGYENVLISGSRSSFGGIREYFTKHGEYDIIDTASLSMHGLTLPESQENEWGFSDEAAFSFAKETLKKLEKESKPWHLMISTIDAHFNGYTYEKDEENGYSGSIASYKNKRDNVYATSSRCLGEFISWLREQPYYKDTTVVIFGDHRNMLSDFCGESEEEHRGRYNLILNSAVSTGNTKERVFTAFDFYPTTLTAAGFTVTGNRLGLGADLFSETETLAEKFGLDYMNEQLEMRSDFYIDKIMGKNDYRHLLKE